MNRPLRNLMGMERGQGLLVEGPCARFRLVEGSQFRVRKHSVWLENKSHRLGVGRRALWEGELDWVSRANSG